VVAGCLALGGGRAPLGGGSAWESRPGWVLGSSTRELYGNLRLSPSGERNGSVLKPKEKKLTRMKTSRIIRGMSMMALLLLAGKSVLASGSANGSGGDMPAFYDCQQFTINFKPLGTMSASSLLQHNGSINTIYMCDQCEAAGMMFTSVLDAIQGDGFNPLWQEVQVMFNVPITPDLLMSLCRDDFLTAAATAGTVTLVPTNEIYRCSVVGTKK